MRRIVRASSSGPQQLAGLLCDSLHTKLLTLPDEVLVYPAQGAGARADFICMLTKQACPWPSIEEMSVEQLLGRIRAGDDVDLIDVRRPAE